jgi:hypothetical protein
MVKLLYILSVFLLVVSSSSLAAGSQHISKKNPYTIEPSLQQPKQENPRSVKFLKFYPNPASEFIVFEFNNGYNRGLTFQVISQIGNKVYDVQNILSRFTINLQNFNRGIYFYVLKDKTGKAIETGKFQVTK